MAGQPAGPSPAGPQDFIFSRHFQISLELTHPIQWIPLRLRMSGAIPLPPLYASMTYTETKVEVFCSPIFYRALPVGVTAKSSSR